jgi:hypothetical protein
VSADESLPPVPSVGSIVRVRARHYLVQDFVARPDSHSATLVRLSCIDDDAQGEPLEVLWEHELDTALVRATWDTLGTRGVDPPSHFAAYLHTLRWNCVTATTPKLFQSPWRAGIDVMPYQLEPLRKALQLPRVNLFIADDVGLGKTIEAALVLRELLMRQRVRRVVVAVPASVVQQWRDELEQRFGLTFIVYDREYVARTRRERGHAVNPFDTHTRFIISHSLLRDEAYATPLRAWLGDFSAGSMLILDEAHHAAPASSAKYAIDSHFTRCIRDLAPRFEHRLFLSATPHNGLSNSFSALMEILDPQRFCRGVSIDAKLRDAVMVRRLKSDLRGISGGFPERAVVQIDLADLPDTTPELQLAAMLDRYWSLRERHTDTMSPSERAAQGLLLVNLQKRLLSSVDAFARTLACHVRSMSSPRKNAKAQTELAWKQRALALDEARGADAEQSALDEDDVEAEAEHTLEEAGSVLRIAPDEAQLLHEMSALAETSRQKPDARVHWLVEWIRKELCAGIGDAQNTPNPNTPWNPRRVLIFTEYAHTKTWLEKQLRAAVHGTHLAEERIKTFHGGMHGDLAEQVKRAFNGNPDEHPLRILIATDAAREGVNLQNHCADLFHFDLPWNPSRMEQRNGRIDRKLQPSPVVRCHYFIYPQRPADRVLEVLLQRTRTIQQELGAIPRVFETSMTETLAMGMGPSQRATALEALKVRASVRTDDSDTELETARERGVALNRQLDGLRTILAESQKALDFSDAQLRVALDASLSFLGANSLAPVAERAGAWTVPSLDRRAGADPTWVDTMDTLRAPREHGVPVWEWRRDAHIRPVVFSDPKRIDDSVVHLHLEHRLVQRLLGRFLAQGFALDDLARACVGQTRDSVPRVVLLGRLSLYGHNGQRLHEEVLSVAARYTDPSVRDVPLSPYADTTQETSWRSLLDALGDVAATKVPPEVTARIVAHAGRDVRELVPHLETAASELYNKAAKQLSERGTTESREMVAILESQRTRIERKQREIEKQHSDQLAFTFAHQPDETRQLQENARFWSQRIERIATELIDEPARIRHGYEVAAHRVEPIGIAWLWPATG